eukprot:2787183-Rhodomonas_salina.1
MPLITAKCHAAKSDYGKVFKERNVQLGRAPRILLTDGAGEMTSAEFEAELSAIGTFHQKLIPYAQHQNGLAESAIRTVSTRTHTLLISSNLPPSYWCYTTEYAVFLENVTRPYVKGVLVTAYEKMFGRSPS